MPLMYSINILYIIQYYLVYGQVPYFNNQSHLALSSTTLTLKNSIQLSTQILKKKKKNRGKNMSIGDGGLFLFLSIKTSKELYHICMYTCL